MTRDKGFKQKIQEAFILVTVVVFGSFVAGEVIVRIFKKEPAPFVIASKNPKLITELNKNYKGINSWGMRDKEFALADIQGLYKIAVIGDSHVYSIKVKDNDDTFPSKLEKYLHESGKNSVKVLNFGIPGYNMAQELEVLQSKALMFEPRLVILQYTINDTHGTNYIHPKYKRLNSLIHQSKLLVKIWQKILYSSFGQKYLYDWIGEKFPDALLFQEGLVGTRKAAPDEVPERQRHPPRTKERVPVRYHYMLGEENWRRHVQNFAQLCQQNNIPILATGFIGPEERAIFKKEGFDVYSFYDIFAGKNMKDYGYNPDNTNDHFDAAGCDFIGKALANYIRKHYLTTRWKM